MSAENRLEVEMFLLQAPKTQRNLSTCLSNDSMLNSFLIKYMSTPDKNPKPNVKGQVKEHF